VAGCLRECGCESLLISFRFGCVGVCLGKVGPFPGRLRPANHLFVRAATRRFAALSTLAKTLIEKRGHLSEGDLNSFVAAGFTKEQVLEVIAAVAASTITNYTGTIANPPLEVQFQRYAWQARKQTMTSSS
jgi:hypothetical protein